MFNQRDIVLIPFPYSDLTGSKKRPALIISNKKLNKTQDRICCLVTTNTHKEDLEIKDNFFEKGDLPFKSFVRPHRIFTINEKIIVKKLCTVSNSFHEKLIDSINEYLKKD
ncbi:MAG: type II toxin-antitoxin system PemK/MazF family toxin [Nanoarchaeota archaeon]|nr:type II toxin-antitoxin system PemK/MazF family toxin [Nanoarchaeota archaeon]